VWFPLPTRSLATIALVGLGVVLALREARFADSEKAHTRFAPMLLLGGFYFFIVFSCAGWLR
jgi:hypothetical protein